MTTKRSTQTQGLCPPEHCAWCDEVTQIEEAWNDEWESYGVRCSECLAWHRSY